MLVPIVTVLICFGITSFIVGNCLMLAATAQEIEHSLWPLNTNLEQDENCVRKLTKLKQNMLKLFQLFFEMKQ